VVGLDWEVHAVADCGGGVEDGHPLLRSSLEGF
jgi:hypothetical protein